MPDSVEENHEKNSGSQSNNEKIALAYFPRGILISSGRRRLPHRHVPRRKGIMSLLSESSSMGRSPVRGFTRRTMNEPSDTRRLGWAEEPRIKAFQDDSLDKLGSLSRESHHSMLYAVSERDRLIGTDLIEPGVVPRHDREKSDSDIFLTRLKKESKRYLKELVKPLTVDIEFSHAHHIRETLLDTTHVLNHLYGLSWKDICKCLTVTLVANEGVYHLDDYFDREANGVTPKSSNRNNQMARALERKNDMYMTTSTLLEALGREDLDDLIAKMAHSVEYLFRMEKIRDRSPTTRSLLEHIGHRYGFYFEPSDKEYMDIGTHMIVSLELGRDYAKDRAEYEKDLPVVKKLCNGSRRLIDIFDALSDLPDDTQSGILPPFGSYVFLHASDGERATILRALDSGLSSKEGQAEFRKLRKIMQTYAKVKADANIDYLRDVTADSEKSKAVKERTLKIGNIVLTMAENISWGSLHYGSFYDHTASKIISAIGGLSSKPIYPRS